MSQSTPNDDGIYELKLRGFGRPSLFSVKKGKIRRKRQLTLDIVRRAKIAANLSGKQTNKFLRHIRYGVGRKFFVSNIREQLTK